MATKHYTREEIISKSLYEIANELKKLGAPVKCSDTNVFLTNRDIEIGDDFESHEDIVGGVTYVWDFWK